MSTTQKLLLVVALGLLLWVVLHRSRSNDSTAGSHEVRRHSASGRAPFRGLPVDGEQIYFSPGDNLEQVDVALINSARSSLTIAMYAFTDRAIADALARAAERGVHVRLYRDRTQFEEEVKHGGATLNTLSREPNVTVRVKHSSELMHEKTMLVDEDTLRDGSGNWSVAASRYQDNQVSVTHDPAQITAFRQNFEAMWSRADNEPGVAQAFSNSGSFNGRHASGEGDFF